jgi:hypothetical protein
MRGRNGIEPIMSRKLWILHELFMVEEMNKVLKYDIQAGALYCSMLNNVLYGTIRYSSISTVPDLN